MMVTSMKPTTTAVAGGGDGNISINVVIPAACLRGYSDNILDQPQQLKLRQRQQMRQQNQVFLRLWKSVVKVVGLDDKYGGTDVDDEGALLADGSVLIAVHLKSRIIAVTKGGACVAFYSQRADAWLEQTIEHNVMLFGNLFCMKWSPCFDVLFMGTTKGVCVWSFESLGKQQANAPPTARFFAHPTGSAVHDLDCHPNGGLFASISRSDSYMLVWDYRIGSSSPLYCLNGVRGNALGWSPSGSHISVTNK
jgi:hypothetical protein